MKPYWPAQHRGLVQPDTAVLRRHPSPIVKLGSVLKNLEANMRLASAASRTLTLPMNPDNPLTVAEAEAMVRIKKELLRNG